MKLSKTFFAVFLIPFCGAASFATIAEYTNYGRSQPWPGGIDIPCTVLMESHSNTRGGETFPSQKLFGDDYTGAQQLYLAYAMYVHGLCLDDLRAPASASHNCFSYVFGATGSWIFDEEADYIRDHDYVLDPDFDDATIALHSPKHGYPEHGSKITTEPAGGSFIYTYTGKYADTGVYETGLSTPGDIYNLSRTQRYKPEE